MSDTAMWHSRYIHGRYSLNKQYEQIRLHMYVCFQHTALMEIDVNVGIFTYWSTIYV